MTNDSPPLIATSAWASLERISSVYPYEEGKIWLGRHPGDYSRAFGCLDDRHVFLYGGTRTDKGRAFIIPNLVKWPGSLVSVDPKGDHATIAAPARAAGNKYCKGRGQETFVLDPMRCADVPDELRAHFDLMSVIDPESPDAVRRALHLAHAMRVPSEDATAEKWAKLGSKLIAYIILHVKTWAELRPEQRTLATVKAYIAAGDVEAAEKVKLVTRSEKHPNGIDVSPYRVLLDNMTENPACGGKIALFARSLTKVGADHVEYFESVRSNADEILDFLNHEGMLDTASKSEKHPRTFDLAHLKDDPKGVSVFICLPSSDHESFMGWQRCMMEIILAAMQDYRRANATGYQLLFCVDELPAFKRMDTLATKVNEIAGAGVKLFLATQSTVALKHYYGGIWEDFISSAGVRIWLGVDGVGDMEYLQKIVGETEIRRFLSTWTEGESFQLGLGFAHADTRGSNWFQSDSEGNQWNESKTDSEHTNWNKARNWNVAKGKNRSNNRAHTDTWQRSTGEQEGGGEGRTNSRSQHLDFPDDGAESNSASANTNWGRQRNWSVGGSETLGRTSGTSKTKSMGGTESHGGGKGQSRTSGVGGSKQHTDGRGGNESATDTESVNLTTGQQRNRGENESLHKKPLVDFGEIRRGLNLPKGTPVDDPAYPGFALIEIRGEDPFLTRRCHYDHDPEFIGCWSPDLAYYPFIPLSEKPLLGCQYTEAHYFDVVMPRDLGEALVEADGAFDGGEFAPMASGKRFPELVYAGPDGGEIKLPRVKVIAGFNGERLREDGALVRLRFDRALDDPERDRLDAAMWWKLRLHTQGLLRKRFETHQYLLLLMENRFERAAARFKEVCREAQEADARTKAEIHRLELEKKAKDKKRDQLRKEKSQWENRSWLMLIPLFFLFIGALSWQPPKSPSWKFASAAGQCQNYLELQECWDSAREEWAEKVEKKHKFMVRMKWTGVFVSVLIFAAFVFLRARKEAALFDEPDNALWDEIWELSKAQDSLKKRLLPSELASALPV